MRPIRSVFDASCKADAGELGCQRHPQRSRQKRAEPEDAQHHLPERSFRTFARTVRLPFAPRPDEVRATFEHGVLHTTLPAAGLTENRAAFHKAAAA